MVHGIKSALCNRKIYFAKSSASITVYRKSSPGLFIYFCLFGLALLEELKLMDILAASCIKK